MFFLAFLAFIWLLECWGRLPASGILVWYMRIHPMCFCSLFYRRGVFSFGVAFSAFPSHPPLFLGHFLWDLLCSFPSTGPFGLECDGCSGLGAWSGGLVAGLRVWAGQSGVLAPWGCDCDCSPRVPWAPNLHLRRGR